MGESRFQTHKNIQKSKNKITVDDDALCNLMPLFGGNYCSEDPSIDILKCAIRLTKINHRYNFHQRSCPRLTEEQKLAIRIMYD